MLLFRWNSGGSTAGGRGAANLCYFYTDVESHRAEAPRHFVSVKAALKMRAYTSPPPLPQSLDPPLASDHSLQHEISRVHVFYDGFVI